jgi:hypothetical protein
MADRTETTKQTEGAEPGMVPSGSVNALDLMIEQARADKIQAEAPVSNAKGEIVGNPVEWAEKPVERAWYSPIRAAEATYDHVKENLAARRTHTARNTAEFLDIRGRAGRGEEFAPGEVYEHLDRSGLTGFAMTDSALKGANAAVNIVGKGLAPITKQTGKAFDAVANFKGVTMPGAIREAFPKTSEVIKKATTPNFYTPLKDMAQQREFEVRRGLHKGDIGTSDRFSEAISSTFAKAVKGNDAERDNIITYLTNATADPTIISNEAARGAAQLAKSQIYKQGEELVKQGVMTKEQFEKYAGEYLPNAYLDHVMDAKGGAGGKLRMDLGYTKARNEALTDEYKAAKGLIKDPAFLAGISMARQGRDIATNNFLSDIAANPNWSLPEQFIEFQGMKLSASKAMEMAENTMSNLGKLDPAAAQAALAQAGQLRHLAEQKIAQLGNVDMSKYAQIPDAPNYGNLRGMFVRKEIRDDLMGTASQMHNPDPNIIERFLSVEPGGYADKATNAWKMAKITLNPPTIARNIMSGGSMLHLSGVDQPLLRMEEAVVDYFKGGPIRKVAEKYGIDMSNFSSEEAALLVKKFRLANTADAPGAIGFMKLAGDLQQIGGKVVDGINYTSNLYGKMETIMKMAKIKDVLAKGGTEEDAFLEAQKWMLDYSLSPRTQKSLRSNVVTGAPFSTFLYKSFPRIVEIAAKNPERFIPYAAVPALMEAQARKNNDWTKEDVETIKQMTNEHMRDKASIYLLPYKDEQGRPQVIDMGYILPWGSFVEMGRKTGNGDMMGVLKDVGLLGMPIPQLIEAAGTHKDPFTGRDIYRSTDTPTEQIASVTRWLWNFAMPTFLSSHGTAGQIDNITKLPDHVPGTVPREDWYVPEMVPEKDWQANDRNYGQIASGFAGINVYPVDIQKGVDNKRRESVARQTDLQKNFYSELNGARGSAEKKAIKKEYYDKSKDTQTDAITGKEALNKSVKLLNRENAKRIDKK